MTLKRYVKSTSETFGLLHQLKLRALRNYIKTTSEEQLEKELRDIEDTKLLRTLWEAGLSARLQEVVLEQLKKIS